MREGLLVMDIRIINNPSNGTVRLLTRKVSDEQVRKALAAGEVHSIGLLQGPLADMVAAADIAEKASGVQAAEIVGSCPAHNSMIGLFGETASVEEAVRAVESRFGGAGMGKTGRPGAV